MHISLPVGLHAVEGMISEITPRSQALRLIFVAK